MPRRELPSRLIVAAVGIPLVAYIIYMGVWPLGVLMAASVEEIRSDEVDVPSIEPVGALNLALGHVHYAHDPSRLTRPLEPFPRAIDRTVRSSDPTQPSRPRVALAECVSRT